MSRRSISKQRGLEMSSRLMPPNVGARRTTVSTISSVSVVARATGIASTPPNCLNSTALPSITGIDGGRPDVAQAQHGRAVGDDGDGVGDPGVLVGGLGVGDDRLAHAGHAGRVRHARGRRRRAAARWRRPPSCRRDAARRPGRPGPVAVGSCVDVCGNHLVEDSWAGPKFRACGPRTDPVRVAALCAAEAARVSGAGRVVPARQSLTHDRRSGPGHRWREQAPQPTSAETAPSRAHPGNRRPMVRRRDCSCDPFDRLAIQ